MLTPKAFPGAGAPGIGAGVIDAPPKVVEPNVVPCEFVALG